MKVTVVGGGIVGLAVARELVGRGADVTVLERHAAVGQEQTGHNSGVLHAGIYYPPGSLKASLCVAGAADLRSYCLERGLPYDECGKLIVAVSAREVARLDGLWERALANGVPDVRRVGAGELAAYEPSVVGVAGLWSPRTAIVDFGAVARSFAADVVAGGGEVRCGVSVADVAALPGDRVVVCAGRAASRLAGSADPRIVPFRGLYYSVAPSARSLVRGLIYPVPDPRYPFLGIHLTRTVHGDVLVGPNAVLAGVPLYRGLARLAVRHWRTGAVELGRTVSKRAFVRQAQRYVPALQAADVVRAASGVRAQAVAADGSLVDDFVLRSSGRVTHVLNAPSPAATSSLAIARYLVDRLELAA